MVGRKGNGIYLVIALLIMLAVGSTLLTSSCVSPKQRTLRLLGSSAGSKTNTAYDYMAKVVSAETDIVASNLPGSEDKNYELLEKGEADITYMDILKGAQAYAGIGIFQGKPHKNLRSVMSMTGQAFVIGVLADSKITKIEDLLGKRVAFAVAGQTSETYMKILFDIGYGLTKEKMLAAGGSIANLADADMGAALTDKTIDCVTKSTSPILVEPSLQAAEALGPGIRLLSPSPEAIAKIQKVYPGFQTGYIKGGVYKNHPKDVFTAAYLAIMSARAGVPDDVIYDFLKVVEAKKHRDAVFNMVKWVEWGEGSIAGINAIPVHPGAAKWLKDNGYNISDMKVGS